MNKTIYLAGGCFWGTQKYMKQIDGVLQTQVGFANGSTENPSYEEVCHNNTGHAETVRVVYDPEKISLSKLLSFYFRSVNPTAVNRQGEDTGSQYRTGIYYTDPAEEPVIRQALQQLATQYSSPIAIECLPLQNFYPAEEYHQDYLDKNPNGYCHLNPGLFEEVYRDSRNH